MNIKIIYKTDAVKLPPEALPVLPRASENDIRFLLAILRGAETVKGAADTAGMTEKEAAESASFWRGAGIAELTGGEDKKPPEREKAPEAEAVSSFTGEDIERIIKTEPEVKSLIESSQKLLEKIFTTAESSIIIYLYDHLRLDTEFIMLLISYCKSKGKRSLRYIEKTALNLYDEGVDSTEALHIYLKNEEKKRDAEFGIRKLYGMGERALTPKEKQYIHDWIIEWKMSGELIALGYEEMMNSIDKPKMSYENAILRKWHEQGIVTPEQAEEAGRRFREGSGETDSSFDISEFVRLAVQRGEDSPKYTGDKEKSAK